MAIQSIGSGSSFDVSSLAQSLLKKLDSNQDGGISSSEFQSALQDSSSNSQDSVELFSLLDGNSDSQISLNELESTLKSLSLAQSAQGTSSAASGGARPAGGGGGGGGGGGVSATDSSSGSSTYYDVRDTNQDGVVSYQEMMAYQLSQASEAQSAQNGTFDYLAKYAAGNYQQNQTSSTTSVTNSIGFSV